MLTCDLLPHCSSQAQELLGDSITRTMPLGQPMLARHHPRPPYALAKVCERDWSAERCNAQNFTATAFAAARRLL